MFDYHPEIVIPEYSSTEMTLENTHLVST